jgi:acetyl-CoA C-acetyltransferase
VYVAGGVESISCVQQEMNQHMLMDPALNKKKPEIYWNMLQTAEQVAKRYNIGREAMDEYGAASQQKACAAQAAGKFNDEIAAITVQAGVVDKVMGMMTKQVTVSADEGLREGTTAEGIAGIKSAIPGGVVSPVWSPAKPTPPNTTSNPWAVFWALRWRVANPMKWALARCMPFPKY